MKTMKKVLSIFLSITMLATTLIFADVFSASAAGPYIYGMNEPVINKTSTRWTPDTSGDFVNVEYPTDIYLNVGEKLQDVGYQMTFTGRYGEAGSTDYRIRVGSDVWGGTASQQYAPSKTMVTLFADYNFTVTQNNALDNDETNWGNDKTFSRKNTNAFNETLTLVGTAGNSLGDYTYSSAGSDFLFSMDHWEKPNFWSGKSWVGKKSCSALETPVVMNVHIYDKAPLDAAINAALTTPPESPNGITNWEQYQAVLATAKEVLAKREVTDTQVKTATDNLTSHLIKSQQIYQSLLH